MSAWPPLPQWMLVVLLVVLQMDWGSSQYNEEVYCSTQQIRRLQESSLDILPRVRDYIDAEYARLHKMKRAIQNIRNDDTKGPADITLPTDAFHVVHMWSELLNEAESRRTYQDLASQLHKAGVPMIKASDKTGAADAVVRLQQVYNISVDDLASGSVKGYQGRPPTVPEMGEVGTMWATARDHKKALEWFELALHQSGTSLSSEDSQWLIQAANSYFMTSRTDKAVDILGVAQGHDPDNKVVQMYLETYAQQLDRNFTMDPGEFPPMWRNYQYEALCRGDQTHRISPDLFCRYRPTAIPYLFFKEEVLSREPRIMLFHDVISDTEIAFVKNMSIPRLQRADVGGPGQSYTAKDRVGKVAWLWDIDRFGSESVESANSTSGSVQPISDRVALITGLSTTYRHRLSSAEALQVVNYGIGGRYEAHYDYYEDEAYLSRLPYHLMDTGDRLATFMFYLSDVREGGATVFPDINVRVPAVKNSAVFWYNINKSGTRDHRTLHAGCPVLIGEKWVANKWIREYGQHFLRPCGLSPDAIDEW